MKIVVLAGGISTERDVSLVSGMGIYKALKSKGHQVMLLDVFLGYANEDWKNVFEKDVDWTASVGAIKDQNPDIDAVKALRPDWKKNFFGPHVIDICQQADVVFMALHGENGENGKIQACFDLNGIRYTGTDYVSSAICMNKAISKEFVCSRRCADTCWHSIEERGNTGCKGALSLCCEGLLRRFQCRCCYGE